MTRATSSHRLRKNGGPRLRLRQRRRRLRQRRGRGRTRRGRRQRYRWGRHLSQRRRGRGTSRFKLQAMRSPFARRPREVRGLSSRALAIRAPAPRGPRFSPPPRARHSRAGEQRTAWMRSVRRIGGYPVRHLPLPRPAPPRRSRTQAREPLSTLNRQFHQMLNEGGKVRNRVQLDSLQQTAHKRTAGTRRQHTLSKRVSISFAP